MKEQQTKEHFMAKRTDEQIRRDILEQRKKNREYMKNYVKKNRKILLEYRVAWMEVQRIKRKMAKLLLGL